MVLDLAKKTYRDLGETEHLYAFIVLDDRGRAYHPVRGGKIARFDPKADRLEKLSVSVDGAAPGTEFTKDDAILNWEVSPDRKTLYAVEMSTNALYAFDLTAASDTLPGKKLGSLLPAETKTDCRAMCVGPDGRVWAAVTIHGRPEGPTLHLVGYRPGDKGPRDFGPVGVANPDFTSFTGPDGKPKPNHHTMRKEKDGTLTPWVPMGVCGAADGSVYVMTIAPFTLLHLAAEKVR
jgi:hypothetical protein